MNIKSKAKKATKELCTIFSASSRNCSGLENMFPPCYQNRNRRRLETKLRKTHWLTWGMRKISRDKRSIFVDTWEKEVLKSRRDWYEKGCSHIQLLFLRVLAQGKMGQVLSDQKLRLPETEEKRHNLGGQETTEKHLLRATDKNRISVG